MCTDDLIADGSYSRKSDLIAGILHLYPAIFEVDLSERLELGHVMLIGVDT